MSDVSSQFSTALVQNLVLTLDLEANGKSAKIVSGHIERFNLSLQPFGHTCAIQFCAFGDEVDPIFTGQDVIKAVLTFKSVDPDTHEEKGAPLLELKGIVTEKCFKRLPYVLTDKTLRLYEITIHDYAKATWDQHYPINIYVNQSMKEIIEKHLGPDVSMEFDWDVLTEKHPITAFSLPHKDGVPEDLQTSFYSFLFWYLQKENGVLTYDYKAHKYAMKGAKEGPEGEPLDVKEWWVTPPVCFLPPTPRYNGKVLKHNFDSLIEGDEKSHPKAFKSIRRDSFDPQNYSRYPEQAHEKVKSTLEPEKNVVEVEFCKIDGVIPFDKLIPGSGLCFKGNGEGTWSKEACYKGKTFCIRSLFVQSDNLNISEELSKPVQSFRMQIKAVLEEEGEPFVARPYFIPPTFPFAIQGKIFSDVGEEKQTTYKIDDDGDPLGLYKVEVPLVGDKKKYLVVPFAPDYMSGQFYYPFTKGQRVELSVYLHTAKILRPSGWQDLVQLPKGIQGCQTVFASNGKDKYTWIRHEFEDDKNSVFTIKQSSSDKQTQSVEIKEEIITIKVDEKDQKTLSIVLNKKTGFTLSLEDKSAKSSQQIVFDGKTMTHTCKDSSATSVIVQKPDEISFDCKKFNIKCDEINFEAKNKITMAGKNNFTVESKIANVCASKVKLGG